MMEVVEKESRKLGDGYNEFASALLVQSLCESRRRVAETQKSSQEKEEKSSTPDQKESD
jgi:hypothetical protein